MASFTKNVLGSWVGAIALAAAIGCSGEDPSSGSSQESVKGAQGQCEDEEEANDKITCSIDADCDSDETCVNGLCTGADGEAEEDEDDEDEDDDADADDCDHADDAGDADDDDADLCAADTDCDADEACTNGLCEDR